MRRMTAEQLRRSTLRRQFPTIRGRGPGAVLDLVDRVGPIQSQSPRAPFLTASSRLPGVAYATVAGLLDDHRLIKSSTLRGTVHTSTAALFPALRASAGATRASAIRAGLEVRGLTVEDFAAELDDFCSTWRTRDEVRARVRDWVAGHGSGDEDAVSVMWGQIGLVRRHVDGRWERRSDGLRRAASAVVPGPTPSVAEALPDLVRHHLAAYGPVLREDLVFFLASSPGPVNAALAALGDEVVRLPGPGSDAYLDLADPPTGGRADPGLRLLPEFDGLVLGFAGRNRDRFLAPEQIPLVYQTVNAMMQPPVLHDGRIVATWRTVTRRSRSDLEVLMLPPYPPLPEDLFDAAVADTARVLDTTITDVRVLTRD